MDSRQVSGVCVFVFVCVCVSLGFLSNLFFVFRNYFLDWDGLGYMSSIEQNFNPSVEDIKRRTGLGQWKKH